MDECPDQRSSAPEDGRNHGLKHVELIEIIKKIIIFASSWLFILLYQRCTVTQTSKTAMSGPNTEMPAKCSLTKQGIN